MFGLFTELNKTNTGQSGSVWKPTEDRQISSECDTGMKQWLYEVEKELKSVVVWIVYKVKTKQLQDRGAQYGNLLRTDRYHQSVIQE